MIGALCALLISSAPAKAVLLCGQRVLARNGAWFSVGNAHLYRIGLDGKGLRQLTFGNWDDTEPSLGPDGQTIYFFRSAPMDLVGKTWVYRVNANGAGLRKIDFVANDRLSPLDYALSNDRSGSASKTLGIPGIPSVEGGTSEPVDVGLLPEGGYICGFWGDDGALCGIKPPGKPRTVLHLFRSVKGKHKEVEAFDSEQRSTNPDGTKAYWISGSNPRILLQIVRRGEPGVRRPEEGRSGWPQIFLIKARTGEVLRERDGQFLWDLQPGQGRYLATGWNWGKGFRRDGAVARQPLYLRSLSHSSARSLLPSWLNCRSALFLPN